MDIFVDVHGCLGNHTVDGELSGGKGGVDEPSEKFEVRVNNVRLRVLPAVCVC